MCQYKQGELLIYLRKSQSDNPYDSVEDVLRKHEQILQDFAVKITGTIIQEQYIFREVVSGETIAARVEIQKVLRLIESPEVKGVLVVDPQRLSRGDLVDCGTIINMFRYSTTRVMTPNRTFDLTEKYDRKFMEMELQHGADYLEYCKEILFRGRLASVMRGNYLGSIPPYGYRKTAYKKGNETIHTLEIVEEEAQAVRKAFDMYANQGINLAEIGRRLDSLGYKPRKTEFWSSSAIKDILANEVYIGKIRWDRRKAEKVMIEGELVSSRPKRREHYLVIEGYHPAIISEELYHKCMQRRGKNARIPKKLVARNPLAGLIECRCGRKMVYQTQAEKTAPRLHCPDQPRCKTASCTFQEMEALVKNILESSITDFRVRIEDKECASSNQKDVSRLEKRLRALEQKEVHIWEKYTEDDMPRNVFDSLMSKNQRERKSVQSEIGKLKAESQYVGDFEEKIVRFAEALEALSDPEVSIRQKNMLLKSCIDKIVYSRESGKGGVREMERASQKHARWNPNEIQVEVYLRQ